MLRVGVFKILDKTIELLLVAGEADFTTKKTDRQALQFMCQFDCLLFIKSSHEHFLTNTSQP